MIHPLRRPLFVGLAVALSLVCVEDARAQPRPAAASPPASPTGAESQARAHFKKGNEHFDRQEWLEALDEFRKALALKRSRATVVDEASCLRQLGRYDEALDAYEALRREFPALPPQLEAKVAPAIAELQGLVGTLVVTSDAPAGASLFVDDRRRGALPLTKPLRLPAGSHALRVEIEGFEPLVAGVNVERGQQSRVELRAKSRQGRLRVTEKHNWALDVELDGKVVGKTPADLRVAPGDHEVRLHGFVRTEAVAECVAPEAGPAGSQPAALDRTEMGSQKATVAVRLYEVTPVPLAADDLDGPLQVDATPAEAVVSVDGKGTRHGTWEGRLRLGPHSVQVTAPGFLPQTREVRVERRKAQVLGVELARDPKLVPWRPTWSAPAGVAYGVGVAGLGVFAVTGGLALAKARDVAPYCQGSTCLTSEQGTVSTSKTLGNVATAGLVVGSAGVAAGTLVLLLYRPDDRRSGVTTGRVEWSAGVGPGSVEIGGRF